MTAFITAFLFVVAGEMGDKTQLLAIAMACRYKAGQVMTGVLIATLVNHGLAVLVGTYLSNLVPINVISVVAGVSFIIFGLWTIRGDSNEDEKKKESRFGPVLTVGIAFFLAEMGDKTQLMTIALAAEYHQPLVVLMGTTSGMLVADGIGILFSTWLCNHVPDVYIKWSAALVFMLFGSVSLYNNVPAWLTSPLYIGLYLLILVGMVYLVGIRLPKRKLPTACDTIAAEEVLRF